MHSHASGGRGGGSFRERVRKPRTPGKAHLDFEKR